MQDDSFTDIPDWLKELEPAPPEETEPEPYEPESPEAPEEDMGPAFDEPEEERDTLVDDLREQAVADEEFEEPDQPTGGIASVFLGLTSTQRFILALLLFLDIALLGCMCLIMTGRIAPF